MHQVRAVSSSLTTEEPTQHVLRSVITTEKVFVDSVGYPIVADFFLEERKVVVVVFALPQVLLKFGWILKIRYTLTVWLSC